MPFQRLDSSNYFDLTKESLFFWFAFKESLAELVLYGFIFILFWLSFVQEFYLLLNDQTEEFSTFLDSMSTCFQIILGTFNAEIFEPTNGGTALRPIFFVAYNVCVLFVMVNLMVSILVEYYQ